MLADMSAPHAPHEPSSPEVRLLLRSIGPLLAHDTRRLSYLTQQVSDWPFLLRLGLRHDLLPALQVCLSEESGLCPPAVGSFLDAHASDSRQRTAILEQELRVVADALRDRHISALVARAPRPLAHMAPREPAVPVLVVRPDDLDAARAALLTAGYAATQPARLDRAAWSCGREMRHHVAPRFGDDGHPAIQLVWHLSPLYVPGQLTWDRLAVGAERYWPDHDALSVPDPMRALLAECVLGGLEAWERLADVSSFGARATLATDGVWTRALAEARLHRVTRRLRLAAGLAREATAARLPPAVASDHTDDRRTRVLVRRLLADASLDQPAPRHALARHRLLARSLDGPIDRLRYGLGMARDQRSRVCLALCQALPSRLPPPLLRNGGPTPPEAIEIMLATAGVDHTDVLYDLGCGDGRVLIAAARRGARAVGVDLDPACLAEARRAIQRTGLDQLITVRRQSLSTTELTDATVVTLNLGRAQTMALSGHLRSRLKPGARIVALNASFGDWEPDEVHRVPLPHGAADRVCLWRVPDDAPQTAEVTR